MRTIDLDDWPVIELWPGRRLFCGGPDVLPVIVSIPRGCMMGIPGRKSDQAFFGSISRTSLVVTGSHAKGKVGRLIEMLVAAERPDGAVAL